MSLNKGEFGDVIYIDMVEDVSTATDLKITLQPESGETKEISSGVTVLVTDTTVGDKTYKANKALQYTTQENDIQVSGRWRKQGQAKMSATRRLFSNYQRFTVLD